MLAKCRHRFTITEIITADNPAFLKELLSTVSRVDLVEKVEEYVSKVVDSKPDCVQYRL